MKIVLFILGALAIAAVATYAASQIRGMGILLVFYGAVLVGLGYFFSWKSVTEKKTVDVIPREKCEHTRTSTTLYVECGDMETRTQRRYIYENYEDTAKVEIQHVVVKDFLGTERDELVFERND